MQSSSALGILHTSHPALFLFIFLADCLSHLLQRRLPLPLAQAMAELHRSGEEGRVGTQSCSRAKPQPSSSGGERCSSRKRRNLLSGETEREPTLLSSSVSSLHLKELSWALMPSSLGKGLPDRVMREVPSPALTKLRVWLCKGGWTGSSSKAAFP